MGKDAKVLLSVAALCIGLVIWRFNVQTGSKPTNELVAEETTTSATVPNESSAETESHSHASESDSGAALRKIHTGAGKEGKMDECGLRGDR